MNRMTSGKHIFFRPERCLLCLSCVLACQMNQANQKDAGELSPGHRENETPFPVENLKVTFSRGTPWIWKCQHCRNAPCVEACFTGGMHLDEKRHTVSQDPERCVGCGSCLLACPFEAIRLLPDDRRPGKCDGCRDRNMPACVQACQSRALVYVDGEQFAALKRKQFVKKLTGSM